MKKYILYNCKTGKTEQHETFSDAEKAVIAYCADEPGLETAFLVGRVSHTFVKRSDHLEAVVIDQESKLTGYIPQEGDVFVKLKMFSAQGRSDVSFERTILKVNPDSVAILNKGNEGSPQIMPIYQWMRWVKGAEMLKRAGKDV